MITVELTFDQVLSAVKRLPTDKRRQLVAEISSIEKADAESGEPIGSDAKVAATTEQLAQAFQTRSQPIPTDDQVLSIDPDDYPLF